MIAGQIDREVWEQPGFTVGAHTSSPPQPWADCAYVAIHYTAATILPDSYDGVLAKLQQSQKSYVLNRGYSYGYNWVVDRAGRVWEVRGADYMCAANGNTTTNRGGPAICCYVNGTDPANLAMTEAIRKIIATCSTAAGRNLQAVKHSELRPTACPGAGLSAQVDAGIFNPKDIALNCYIATPPPKYRKPHRGSFYVCDGAVRYATTPDVEYAAKNNIPQLELDEQQYELVYRNVYGEAL